MDVMQLFRTLLFAPGARVDLLEKSQSSTADAVIFDLEDSVPPQAKTQARADVRRILQKGLKKPLFLRVNHPRVGDCKADLSVMTAASETSLLRGVVLPKAELPEDIEELDHQLRDLEARHGLLEAQLKILPLIETCLGLRNTFDMARASKRVCGMSLASAEEGDFMVDLGGRWTPQSLALAYPRSKLVVDARAAGLHWLVDGVFMNLKDADALRNECLIARELGFIGKLAIHPAQIDTMHEVFTPSAQEIAYAKGLLAAFQAAESQGIGAVRYEGMMVDYANVRLAQRTLLRLQEGLA